MPSPSVDLGSGWALTLSGFTLEAVSVRWTGMERAAVDSTHLGTPAPSGSNVGNRTFLMGKMVDSGRLEGQWHFNPDQTPPIHAAPDTGTVTWPSTGATGPATWAAQMAMIGFDVDGVGIDEKMIANCVLKLTGEITITAGT